MLYIETYTSPIDSLIAGSWGGADGQQSGAIGVGRFRVAVGATCVDVKETDRSLDEIGSEMLKIDRDAAMNVARQEGHDDATAHAVNALNQATAKLEEARVDAEESLATNAITLAVEIARQVMKVQIASGDYALEQIVRSTLSASEIKRGECAVHLNPVDAQALESVVFRDGTVIVADGDIPRGSVRVETPRGLLVRDPNAALNEICEQLLEDFA
jgi:flagellar biosynthesis/type III secretory pathway protein FliH